MRWQKTLQNSAKRNALGSHRAPKVVVDTNIWYSAFLYGGKPEKVVNFCLDYCRIVLSESLLDEIMYNLKQKAKAPYRWRKLVRQNIESFSHIVATDIPDEAVVRDPKDEHVIVAALSTKSDIIISGDKDLLELGTYSGIAILSTSEFLEYVSTLKNKKN